MASTTADPFVYAAAIDACEAARGAHQPPSCGLASPEQWARIDPGNAVPWLHVADRAQARGDTAAVDDALRRVASARTSALYGDQVPRIVDDALASSTSDRSRGQAAMAAANVAWAWSLPSYRVLTEYCSAGKVRDGNRWQTCDALVDTLTTRPSSMVELQLATRMAERLGWPDDRYRRLRDESDALYAVSAGIVDPSPGTTGCAAVAEIRRQLLGFASIGEVGVARGVLAQSGRSARSVAEQARGDWQARPPAPMPPWPVD